MGSFELRVLGAVEVERDGRRLPIGGPKPRLVLAMLAAAKGTVVSAERLCDELWGDDQPADPGAVLQSNVSRLRAALRPDLDIVGRSPGYTLEISDELIDAGRFELLYAEAERATDPRATVVALDEALGCFRGAAFEEFADREWAQSVAVRLDELKIKAEQDRIAARLALGEHASLVPELEKLVAEHPLQERPWGQLALALYRSGRTADALRRLSSLRTVLRDELGLDLSPNMRELETRLLTDDPTLLFAASETRRETRRRPQPAPTSLVGRDADIELLRKQLRGERLVTLVGPGGVGKTRLGVQLANDLCDELRGEVFVIELAPVQGPASMVAAIATAMDVQPRQHLSIEETLFEFLSGRQSLLVLDNCEHLRAPIASLVDRLLRACADITVLATSREVLGLPSEHVWRVEPLAEESAVRLFVERASAARVGFALGPENIHAIGQIARRVDGLPLAIELAAARMRVMSAPVLAERLETRLDLLSGAQTSMIERHRSLQDLVTWSHDLLDTDEQRLFARLCVFVGGFGLDAVEAVCSGAGLDAAQVPSLLANLVDKSIVQMIDPDVPCYRLLESLREYGADRLDDGEHATVSERHAHWYVAAAERSATMLTTDHEGDAVAQLDRDFDNVRAAFAWLGAHDDVDSAVRLVIALREYAFRRMRIEALSWADEILESHGLDGHPRTPLVLSVAAYARFVRGDLDQAIKLADRAATVAESIGTDSSGLAERVLSNAYFYRGEVARAMEWSDRMVASAREGSPARLAHALYMRSVGYTSLGDSVKGAHLAGEARAAARASGSPTALAQAAYAIGISLEATSPDEAAAHLQQAADLAHDVGNRWIEAFALTEVLWLEARQGQPREALARYAEVIDLWYRGGDWANQWLSLRHVFGILVQLDDCQGAATLHGALTAAGAAYALPFEASDAERIAHFVDDLRQKLGGATFAATIRRGAAMSDREIVQFVRERIHALAPS